MVHMKNDAKRLILEATDQNDKMTKAQHFDDKKYSCFACLLLDTLYTETDRQTDTETHYYTYTSREQFRFACHRSTPSPLHD